MLGRDTLRHAGVSLRASASYANPIGSKLSQIQAWGLVLMVAIAALTSLGTTSPRYRTQQAMYLP